MCARYQLMHAASGVGEPGRCGFAQAMRRALRKPREVALIAKPVAETRRTKRLPELRHQERQVIARHGGQRALELGMNREDKRGAGLLLPHGDGIAPDMLPAHAHNIAAPLCGIEQQRQPKPRSCVERM